MNYSEAGACVMVLGIDTTSTVSTIGFNRALDFCVWVLEVDGLQVPPFDRRQEGSGSLRALGLDARGWRRWVEAVADALEQLATYQDRVEASHTAVESRFESIFLRHERRVQERSSPGRLLLLPERVALVARYMAAGWRAGRDEPRMSFPNPALLWRGNGAVGDELAKLWDNYRKNELATRRRSWKTQVVRDYFVSPAFQSFGRRMASRRTPPAPPILVCFVNYPGPVVYPIPPSVVILGTRRWSADPDTFQDVVSSAVETLVAASGS